MASVTPEGELYAVRVSLRAGRSISPTLPERPNDGAAAPKLRLHLLAGCLTSAL